MKSVYLAGISLSLAVILSGCMMQRQLPVPGRTSRPSPPIVEQTLPVPPPSQDRAITATPSPMPAPVPVVPAVPATASETAAAGIPVSYLNDRIFEYGRKLERWKALDDQSLVIKIDEQQTQTMVRCFRDLQQVLNGYQTVRDTALQRNVNEAEATFDAGEILELQRQDLSFLEGICGRLLGEAFDRDAGWQERREGADLNQVETLIERYSTNGEYNEVIQVWSEIPPQQIERVDLKTRILYGNALTFLDQPEKAAQVYQQIVDQMSASREQPTDLLSLRKVLADLFTAYGNFPAAQRQYDLIANDYLAIGKIDQWAKLQLSILKRSEGGGPELNEYAALLRAYLGYLPERDGYSIIWKADEFRKTYPYSPVTSNVDALREDVQQRADTWFNGYMTKAEALSGEKKYQEAMETLQKIPEAIVGADQFQRVKDRLDAVVLAESVERETAKIQHMQELQERWNEGMLLADKDEFDAAIQIFTGLLESEFSARAAEKIKELSLKAAMNERRKAADLFIRFTKTEDTESKKRLLIESRQVLKNILVHYPDVEIASKVVGNIQRVEQEMNTIDPLLLPAIEEDERRQAAQQTQQPTAQEPQIPAGVDAFDLPVKTPPTPAQLPASQQLPVRIMDQPQ